MFKKILVPIELQHESSWERALPVAVDQSKLYDASLILLHVIPNVRPVDLERHVEEDARKTLKELAEKHAGKDVDVEIRTEHHDSIHRCIRQIAEQENIDLIVMNSHHPELSDYILGSNASQVVHHADCSVFVVRSKTS